MLLASSLVCAQPPDDFARIDATVVQITDSATGIAFPVRVNAFQIARNELTQREYQAVMGENPSAKKGPDLPAENIRWLDAIAYTNRRSTAEGLRACYDEAQRRVSGCNGYRLPTELEWKLAAGAMENLPEALKSDANLYRGANSIGAIHATAIEGPRPVGAGTPNARGIHDLAGNVWEWCEDRFHASVLLDAVDNPRGPQTGTERVLRGGSFLTRPGDWNRGFRSSMLPGLRSPYVGFRLVRQITPAEAPQDPPFQGVETVSSEERRAPTTGAAMREKWLQVLGRPEGQPQPSATILEQWQEPAFDARLLQLEAEAGNPWRALLLLPPHRPAERLPVLVVPYYDVDTPAGLDLGGRNTLPPGIRAFARVATLYGFAALAVRWAGESNSPGYYEAVADLEARHPGVTGLGFWAWQASRVVDWLVAQPEVDASRIAIMGHSLGGKMALYAGAFEPRFRAVVSSEPGIAFAFTNYGDPWYLGERLFALPDGTDQHELLELLAPRPFLLIAGESADGNKSLPLLRRAAVTYRAKGKPEGIAVFNHRTGHSPTAESVVAAMEWLRRQLSTP